MPYKDPERQKEYEKEKRIRNRQRKKELIASIKAVPCADCGVEYPPYVMQFDHVRGEKEFDVGANTHRIGLKKLLEEIEKCDVVCANCHAIRTWGETVTA